MFMHKFAKRSLQSTRGEWSTLCKRGAYTLFTCGYTLYFGPCGRSWMWHSRWVLCSPLSKYRYRSRILFHCLELNWCVYQLDGRFVVLVDCPIGIGLYIGHSHLDRSLYFLQLLVSLPCTRVPTPPPALWHLSLETLLPRGLRSHANSRASPKCGVPGEILFSFTLWFHFSRLQSYV